jgi:hypothetical protein
MEMDPGRICRQMPAGRIVHVVLDNYAAHKRPKVRASLGRHPHVVFHFTPSSTSWPTRSRPRRQAEPAATHA